MSTPTHERKPRLRGVSHEWGFYISLLCGALLIASAHGGRAILGAAVFAAAVSGLLGTSALYHRVDWRAKARRWMRRLDHVMIFVLIAASNTPFALLALHGTLATVVLCVAWSGALAAAIVQLVWTEHPKWVSSVCAISLGWVAIATLTQLPATIGWVSTIAVVVSGVLYTVGAVIYARERPNPLPGVFGYHELFHAFVLAAAATQYAVIAFVVLPKG
ncbi:MAG: hemolysin III family protein [Solirubrobacteraceae bacterium]